MWRRVIHTQNRFHYGPDLLRMVSVVINTQNKVLFKLTQAFFFKCSSYTPLETVFYSTVRAVAYHNNSPSILGFESLYPHMTR